MLTTATDLIAKGKRDTAATNRRYFAVAIATLAGLPTLRCDLYVQLAGCSWKTLYRSADIDLPIGADGKLNQREVRHLYLRVEDQDRFD